MLNLKLQNEASFNRSMERIKKSISDREKVNAQAVVIVDRWIQKNFESEGEPFGGWTPLSPVTIAMRTRNKEGNVRILQDTGQLKTRWKHLYDEKTAAIQSGVPYATLHNNGGWTKFGGSLVRVPKRQILPEKEHIWDKLKKLFSADLQKKLKLKAE